jgi:hypothetical protein
MTAITPDVENLSLNITEGILVRSSITATFAAMLEEMGPSNVGYQDAPMPMVLEAWPGGRWFRDLGDKNGSRPGDQTANAPRDRCAYGSSGAPACRAGG